MKISKSIFLIIAGLFCFVIVFLCFEDLPSQETSSLCEISAEFTKIVAEKKLQHQKMHLMKKEFRNGIVAPDNPTVFQDLNGKCIAHCYKVIDQSNNNYLGYIVVSAISSLSPFLTSSAGQLPSDNLHTCRVKAINKIGTEPSSYSFLYLEGPAINYFVRFWFAGEENIILSLKPIGIISQEEAINRQKTLENRINKGKLQAEEQWNSFFGE